MKNKISMITLLLGTSGLLFAGESKADGQGFYVGASAGYSALNTPSGSAFDVQPSTNSLTVLETGSTNQAGGFGGSLFAGYNINKTYAVELDYTTYAQSSYTSNQSAWNTSASPWTSAGQNSASLDYNTYSVDLFLKGTVPVIAQVSAFAKIGVSYVNQEVKYSNPATSPTINVNSGIFATPDLGTTTYTAFRPSGAIGLSYQATEHLSTSIFAQGFLGEGDFSSDSSAIASAYVVGASVSYDFL